MRALLDERYGRRSSARHRRLAVAAVAVATAAALGVLLWIALHAALPRVSADLLGYEVRDAGAVHVRIEVRRDPDLAVRCLLRAQNVDNVTVGRLDLTVPPSADRTVALGAVIPTTSLAINGELEECTAVDRA